MLTKSFTIVLVSMLPVLLGGCLTMPTPPSGAKSQPTSQNVTVSRPSREELEAARRSELSQNDSLVEFRAKCEGLYIPEVKRTLFQGLIPMYSMRVLNNSGHRYAVKYDLTLVERTRNVLVNASEQFTEERDFIVRPNSFIQFELAKQNHSGGRTVAGVKEIVVLSCEKT